MSAVNLVEIRCDGCPAKNPVVSVAYDTATAARSELREDGWLVGQRGGLDYCPKCAKEMRKIKQQTSSDWPRSTS